CMKTLASVLQWVLGILALAIAVLSLSPSEWKQKLLIWSALVHLTNSVILLMMTLVVAASAVNLYLSSRQQVVVWRTRKKWWDTKLLPIIQVCEKLVIVDSYQGSKHQFWTSIENRLKEDRPFHFVLLDLAKGDPMLAYCMDTSMVHSAVADIDLKAIERLLKERDASGKGGNKTIEFGYWTGESQGPLVSWTINGRETIAAGLWQQVNGNTDLSPWLVSKRGPIFESLKQHRECLLHKAKARGSVHSSVVTLLNPLSGQTASILPPGARSATANLP
ncbi:MAG: hypothetical protein JOZ32_14935, partial [Bryobacterales bacterium]|nr:hypothetical protein [Bryobacterales bacterium]